MNLPDPTRTYETFLPLRLPEQFGPGYAWWIYLRRLRTRVSPLVRELQAAGIIEWYGFLVHDHHSGVPTSADDPEAYLHLRLSLSPEATLDDLQSRLPDVWQWTRPMQFPDPPYLDRVVISTLRDQEVRLGWKLLGDHSEWVLNFVEAHDPELDIPSANAAQLLHYLDNMLQIHLVWRRSPAPPIEPAKKAGKGKKKAKKAGKGKRKRDE